MDKAAKIYNKLKRILKFESPANQLSQRAVYNSGNETLRRTVMSRAKKSISYDDLVRRELRRKIIEKADNRI